MANVTNVLTASVQVFRSVDNEEVVNFDITNLNFPSSFGLYVQNYPCIQGVNVIALPVATVYQIYIKFNGPTTAQGLEVILKNNQMSVAQVVGSLYPGDVFVSWQTPPSPSGSTNAGYQSLSVAPQSACTIDYFIGA